MASKQASELHHIQEKDGSTEKVNKRLTASSCWSCWESFGVCMQWSGVWCEAYLTFQKYRDELFISEVDSGLRQRKALSSTRPVVPVISKSRETVRSISSCLETFWYCNHSLFSNCFFLRCYKVNCGKRTFVLVTKYWELFYKKVPGLVTKKWWVTGTLWLTILLPLTKVCFQIFLKQGKTFSN